MKKKRAPVIWAPLICFSKISKVLGKLSKLDKANTLMRRLFVINLNNSINLVRYALGELTKLSKLSNLVVTRSACSTTNRRGLCFGFGRKQFQLKTARRLHCPARLGGAAAATGVAVKTKAGICAKARASAGAGCGAKAGAKAGAAFGVREDESLR